MEKKHLILLIDDNPINSQVLKGFLSGLPVEIITARNGIEGLNLTRKMLPDVILLDVLMPGLDGFEVCQQIRFDSQTRHIPVIFITSSEKVKKRILEEPETAPDAVLFKPINKVDLLILIRSQFRSVDYRHRLEREIAHITRYSRRLEEAAASSMANVNRSEELSILLLAKLAESKDTDTGEHLNHISKYCECLAEKLREIHPDMQQVITESYVDTLMMAAPLHDIGKVGIQDDILNKPGKYESDEMDVMKRHVSIGAHLLETALDLYMEKPFLKMGVEIARYHHERYNGTGYLEGKLGREIPLSARIVALADVYDAMRSPRRYKGALSHEDAKAYITESRGKHFDPLVVDSFMKCEDDFQSIHLSMIS